MKNKIITVSSILLIGSLFTGCSSKISPYNASLSIVNDAIKACSLGYTTDTTSIFTVAYNNADANQKDLNFKLGMEEALEGQITILVKNMNNEKNSKELIELVKGTQACVINEIDKRRPKRRKDFLNECRDDIQEVVAGKGGIHPKVKELTYLENHQKNTNNDYAVAVYIDHGGTRSHWRRYLCQKQNNQYYGLLRLSK